MFLTKHTQEEKLKKNFVLHHFQSLCFFVTQININKTLTRTLLSTFNFVFLTFLPSFVLWSNKIFNQDTWGCQLVVHSQSVLWQNCFSLKWQKMLWCPNQNYYLTLKISNTRSLFLIFFLKIMIISLSPRINIMWMRSNLF